VFTALQFTSYSRYGESKCRKPPKPSPNAGKKEKFKGFRCHSVHTVPKHKLRIRETTRMFLQWKDRGGHFTEKKHKTVNSWQKWAIEETVSSIFHKIFTKCEGKRRET
jgi:hypothetical protein